MITMKAIPLRIGMASMVVAGCLIGASILGPEPVAGSAVADRAAVADVMAEREASDVNTIAAGVKADMQAYFDDPSHMGGQFLYVGTVNVIKVGDHKYEAMVSMSSGTGRSADIPVHVTADEGYVMWSTDPGVFVALLN